MRKGIKDSKRRNENEKKHRKTAQICGLIFVCFLFVYGGIYAVLHYQVNKRKIKYVRAFSSEEWTFRA